MRPRINDHEVIVTLHGNKIDGRYALIQTDGKNWPAHQEGAEQPQAGDLASMLAPRVRSKG
jgi:bifunctional non-homologous end joining protein LigD